MDRRRQVGRLAIGLIVALAGALTGCTAPASPGPAITLRLGTDDAPGVPATAQILQFAREVGALSHGRIAIEPVWHAEGVGERRWDEKVAALAAAGTVDLALVSSRAWDQGEVTSLRPLDAPFLIDSDALLKKVLTSDLAGRMLAGLSAVKLTGLALWPEGMRHPFGSAALTAPAAYEGGLVRAPASATTAKMFRAFGADVTDGPRDPIAQRAVESSFALQRSGIGTGNVTFYPKVNVLIASDTAHAGLDDGARDVLQKAAAATRDWAFRNQPTDDIAAERFCESGGIVELADAADLAELRQRAEPVVADIRSEGGNAAVLAAIAGMKAELDEQPQISACGSPDQRLAVAAALAGVYRYEITKRQFAGTAFSDRLIAMNTGVFTWTLSGGVFRMRQQSAGQPDATETGTYRVDGELLILNSTSYPGDESFRVRRDADGTLHLSPVRLLGPIDEIWMASAPWTRIGEPPAPPAPGGSPAP